MAHRRCRFTRAAEALRTHRMDGPLRGSQGVREMPVGTCLPSVVSSLQPGEYIKPVVWLLGVELDTYVLVDQKNGDVLAFCELLECRLDGRDLGL